MKTPDRLLARLINCLADQFKDELVLKGGMQLRLLNSPRRTQDLDYAWKRAGSRKFFAKKIKVSLEKLSGIKVSPLEDEVFTSRGFILDVEDDGNKEKAKVEINVVKAFHQNPQPLATTPLANQFNLEIKIVSSLALPEAFSHKLAAAIERGLARDFYDLTQFEPLTSFDETTLKARLSKLSIDRQRFTSVSPQQASALLKKRFQELSEERIEQELSGLLDEAQMRGIRTIMAACTGRIAAQLEAMQI
jgi:predicted nucleotidyltransferase component of viral defense system